MGFVIKLDKLEWIESIRAAIRAEGWTGTSGCKEWAKKTYDATLNYNCYGNMSSIKFKTEEICQKFAKVYEIPYLTNVQKLQEDHMYKLLMSVTELLERPSSNSIEIIKSDILSAINNIKATYGVK